MSVKLNFAPLILDLEKVKAAIEPAIIETIVVAIAINKLLNTYLERGISKLLSKAGNTL